MSHAEFAVLIPSSSGLHFRANQCGDQTELAVLIPSSSGLHFREDHAYH